MQNLQENVKSFKDKSRLQLLNLLSGLKIGGIHATSTGRFSYDPGPVVAKRSFALEFKSASGI